MSEREEFLSWVGSVLKDAEVALHNGDADPRRAIWSEHDPVTVLGAWKTAIGKEQVWDLFAALEKRFSDCLYYSHDVVEADVIGDLAYTVGFEHSQVSMDGEPQTNVLRATQIYRREDGEWKVVHRHADAVPDA